MKHRWLSGAIYSLTSVIGIFAFLYPFLWPSLAASAESGPAQSSFAPLTLAMLVSLCFIALLLEIQGDAVSTKFVALLGVLVAINAVLRFVESAIPGPGGFSPIFFLILLTGYAYGARFGFLMGALTLLVSALITGGLGPWLPYQMFTAGWVGLSAPALRPLTRWLRAEGRRFEVVLLAVVAAAWGFLYGIIINLWSWPFAVGAAGSTWIPGMTLQEMLKRYAVFYGMTSLWWDLVRVLGNVVMILAFGAPTLRVLRRFQRRFDFTYHPRTSVEVSDLSV